MKDIKNIILSALFLAFAVITTLFEIPYLPNELGLKISFSICVLFLALRQVGFKLSLIIAFIFPWFSLLTGSGGIVGAAFIFISSIIYVVSDYLFVYRINFKYSDLLFIPLIIVLSIVFLLLNILLFIPLWGAGWGPITNDFGNYLIKNAIVLVPFNIINITINVGIGLLINIGMEKIQ